MKISNMNTGVTLVRTVVEPNGPGGIDGPPIPLGISKICRVRKGQASISVQFNPPASDLLDTDFDALSDDEIIALTR